jgi:uncharacterized RDD family membrane protein YckC
MMALRPVRRHHLHVPPDPIRILADMIVPKAVDSLDLNEVIGEIDLNQTLARVDLNALLARLDLDALIARIDLNGTLSRVDLEAVLDRLDFDHLLQQIDVDRLLERIDIMGIVERVQVDAIVTATASQTGRRVLDLLRRQLLGLDVLVTRLVNRVRARTVDEPDAQDGSFTGQLAGAASRLLSFLVDAVIVFLLFAGGIAVGFFLASLFVGHNLRSTSGGGLWHIIAFVVFGGLYQWVGLVIAGRTLGMLLSGLRVTAPDGTAIQPWAAARRVVVFPFSFVLGLGLVGIVIGRRHRALHDVAAPSLVRYDWGDRHAEIGQSLARLLARPGLGGEGAPAAPEPGAPTGNGVVTGELDIAVQPITDGGTDGSPTSAAPIGRPGEDG